MDKFSLEKRPVGDDGYTDAQRPWGELRAAWQEFLGKTLYMKRIANWLEARIERWKR